MKLINKIIISILSLFIAVINVLAESQIGTDTGSGGKICAYSPSGLLVPNAYNTNNLEYIDGKKVSVEFTIFKNSSYKIKVSQISTDRIKGITTAKQLEDDSWMYYPYLIRTGGTSNKNDIYLYYNGWTNYEQKIAKWNECPKRVDIEVERTNDNGYDYKVGNVLNIIVNHQDLQTQAYLPSNLIIDSLSITKPGDETGTFDDDAQEEIEKETEEQKTETKNNICTDSNPYVSIDNTSNNTYRFYRGETTGNIYVNSLTTPIYYGSTRTGDIRIDNTRGQDDLCYNYLYVGEGKYILGDDCCLNPGTEKIMANYQLTTKDDKAICSAESYTKCGKKAQDTPVVTPTKGNMSEMLDVCESSGTLQVIYVAKIVFAFICYAVPLLIAITLTIDISKVVTDTTQVKKVVDVAKKRILIGLLLLFTPTLVKLLINSLGSDSDLQRCYNNAKPSHIQARKDYEKEYFQRSSSTGS